MRAARCAPAVPRAWVRARRTILSADAVSFLAAAILYWLAIGDVKGFAFTLGMSTVLDLVVVFLFTHPVMLVLSRYRSFGSNRFSGLGRVETPVPRPGTHLEQRRRTPNSVGVGATRAERPGQERLHDRPRDHGAGRGGTGRRRPGRRRAFPRKGTGTRRRAPARWPLTHRLYNGEAGLDVVGHSKLIYKITAGRHAHLPGPRSSSGASTSGSTSRAATPSRCRAPTQNLTVVRTAAEGTGAAVASAQVVGGNTILLRTGQLTSSRPSTSRTPWRTRPASPRRRSARTRSAPTGARTSPIRR